MRRIDTGDGGDAWRSWGDHLPVLDLMEQAATDLEQIESMVMPHCNPDLLRSALIVDNFRAVVRGKLGLSLIHI